VIVQRKRKGKGETIEEGGEEGFLRFNWLPKKLKRKRNPGRRCSLMSEMGRIPTSYRSENKKGCLKKKASRRRKTYQSRLFEAGK